ncbi:unknown protein [Seminavis robusta]|uniref:Uncharacterized protein n=1 Tax=Seminavis robusta TaxID=568900 RepID=A0A9N8F2P8_9STRA|nr:unknown protein [Seminavis robusta]|eukprot:Sro2779_g336930.1 n/a (682) ;mRNA; f:5592-7637
MRQAIQEESEEDSDDEYIERQLQEIEAGKEKARKERERARPGQYGSSRLLEGEINLSSSSSSSSEDEELKDTPEKTAAQKDDFVDLVSPPQLSQPDSLSQFPAMPAGGAPSPNAFRPLDQMHRVTFSSLHPNVQREYIRQQQESQAEWQRYLDNQCPMPTHLMGFRQSPAPAPVAGFSRVPPARGTQLPVASPVARRRSDSPAAPVLMDSATTKKSRSNTGRATPTQEGRPPTPQDGRPPTPQENNDGQKKKSVPRKTTELPPKVAAFTYEHKHRLELGEEMYSRSKDNPGPFTVAQFIVFGSESRGNFEKFDIDKNLTCEQLRKLATNFGCKGVSSIGKFEIRKRMAIRCTAATAYNNPEILNTFASARELKINSVYRLINVCVHANYFQRFVDLHANKTRNDHESNTAGPYKQFWIDIAEFYNDTENDNELCTIYGAVEEEDERQFDMVTAGPINPRNFNKLNHESCCQLVKDAMKSVEKIHGAMKKSGQGSNDPWSFCRKSVLTIRKGVEVAAEIAYYAYRIREAHPQLEGSWDAMLSEDLAASSTSTPTASKAPPPNNASVATPSTASTGSSANESLISSLGAWNESTKTAADQRQTYIDMKTSQAAEERLARMWNEYDRLSLRVMDLRDNGNAAPLLHNLATRVRALEDKLEIQLEFSVVKDTDFLPGRQSNSMEE